jgi:predicted RNA-binding protein with PUA-like domain
MLMLSARNNLRAMKKGDLSFFYHSSCKVPAIVGIMEIVQEHTPDRTNPLYQLCQNPPLTSHPVSAHDPSAPYHDPSSSPADPKWSLVHVSFRQKLETPVTLKDLRAFQAEKDSPLANMQMLKLTRLSVSRVTPEEWEFLISVMKKNGDDIMSA